MRGTELLDKMELVNPAYIEAAGTKPGRKRHHLKRWCTVAACLCLVLSLGLAVPAFAATVPAFYDVLYAISPSVAQFFKPVQLSCEDNGIRMEVVATYIHDDTAEIYISMQDLEGERLDETVDLFDSYRIHTPFESSSFCKLVSYEPATRTATFLIGVEQWHEQDIVGDKLTFSVREFLSHKKKYEGVIPGVDLESVELNTMTQTVHPRGIGGKALVEAYKNSADREGLVTLKPSGSLASPVEGVTLTGIGYVDGNLHVQAYYEDILKTDNHGSIVLRNKETQEIIPCYGTISFFDEARAGSYEDYIFTGIDADTLGAYELHGDFITSSGSVEGDWSVTFPLE